MPERNEVEVKPLTPEDVEKLRSCRIASVGMPLFLATYDDLRQKITTAEAERDALREAVAAIIKARKWARTLQESDCPEGQLNEATLAVEFRIDEAGDLIAKRPTLLRAVDDEPEFPGNMPDEMWAAIRNDRDAMTQAMRTAVKLTKQGIRDRLKALASVQVKAEVGEDDIVQKLRGRQEFGLNGSRWMMLNQADRLCQEAANKIEELQAAVAARKEGGANG